jgi:uncharacterized membrane protein YebE (DUF533 family)
VAVVLLQAPVAHLQIVEQVELEAVELEVYQQSRLAVTI